MSATKFHITGKFTLKKTAICIKFFNKIFQKQKLKMIHIYQYLEFMKVVKIN